MSEKCKINLLNELIIILGRGVSKYKDIVINLNQNKNSRCDYLINKLIDMNIIKKVNPINQKSNVKK